MKLAPYIPVTTGSLTPENQVFISALDQLLCNSVGKLSFSSKAASRKSHKFWHKNMRWQRKANPIEGVCTSGLGHHSKSHYFTPICFHAV